MFGYVYGGYPFGGYGYGCGYGYGGISWVWILIVIFIIFFIFCNGKDNYFDRPRRCD
ncbi:MAG: sporulation protein YjcZ [Bacilli bacterium]|nr:sporulation protein YjcZ [Bacilli bacterium]